MKGIFLSALVGLAYSCVVSIICGFRDLTSRIFWHHNYVEKNTSSNNYNYVSGFIDEEIDSEKLDYFLSIRINEWPTQNLKPDGKDPLMFLSSVNTLWYIECSETFRWINNWMQEWTKCQKVLEPILSPLENPAVGKNTKNFRRVNAAIDSG